MLHCFLVFIFLFIIITLSGGVILTKEEAAKLVEEAVLLEKSQEQATDLWLKAAEAGNETAQYNVGVMYAWGLNGLEKDETKAILHFYFSALGGYIPAQLALGYRHSRGDGVPANCRSASIYLELAANNAIDQFTKTGAVEPGFTAERILSADEAKMEPKTYADVDVVDYYHNLASKGDSAATGTLGRIYYYGARGVQRDLLHAYQLLSVAASKSDLAAMTSLGHILLQGVPPLIEKNPEMAWKNFTAAANAGHGPAFNGLGYMSLFGYPGVVEQNIGEALKYFVKASDSGVPEAFYNLGSIYVASNKPDTRDFSKAFRYFGLAAQKGSILGLHKVAHMTLHGIGTMKSCKSSTQYFMNAAERAYFATTTHDQFSEAFSGFRHAPLNLTLERYLRLAEMGYEIAETNAARVYDEISSKIYSNDQNVTLLQSLHQILDFLGFSHPPLEGSASAMHLYERAAEQGNFKARVRVGDFYYYGQGDVGEPDFIEAAAHYRLASEGRDPIANFNLGYQHHYGLGLAKDPHLAKRYYDLAAETSTDSKFAVSLVLTLLWFETAQHALSSGDKFSTDDAELATWVDWWQSSSSSSSSLLSWVLNFEIANDTLLVIFLFILFFGIGWYREYRNERRRAVARGGDANNGT